MSKILKALERKYFLKKLYGMGGTGNRYTGQKRHAAYKKECLEFQAVFGMSSMAWSIETLLSVSLDQPCSLSFFA